MHWKRYANVKYAVEATKPAHAYTLRYWCGPPCLDIHVALKKKKKKLRKLKIKIKGKAIKSFCEKLR